jgi:hypothetical protein
MDSVAVWSEAAALVNVGLIRHFTVQKGSGDPCLKETTPIEINFQIVD